MKEPDTEVDFKTYLEKAGVEDISVSELNTLNAPTMQQGLYYLHTDHLGTATFVTNSSAQTTQFFLNLPFGETMLEQRTGVYNNPYKFNAKELDKETGLYYYGARYYNPRASIWYGVDPVAVYNPSMETQFYGNGQHNGGVYFWGNLNPYIYTYQNPIKYIDPDGKQVVTPFIVPPPPLVPGAIPSNKKESGVYYRPGIPFPIFDTGSLLEGVNKQLDKSNVVMLGFTLVAVEGFKEVYNRTKSSLSVLFSDNLRPEKGYEGTGKHGLKWKEGGAEAKKTLIPQGQWGSKEDLDYAGQKASELKPREGAEFELPIDTKSVVHMPDGSTKKATHMWLRNNGNGKTFHGYPKVK
ncbi:RHS repeat-associated core domain-containing protein [Chryseobacterium sp. MEBOG06]|uniref:RHS repeat domain-containing protein n=1 Tax=Chryseobacterium sp. MEBOG06 TaxID=2879938 RepID=UPI001F3C54BF|nr:RHS repeat-associated core domain-containing protein [Chryseobacterium sp. MEBOG06]UKB85049.1 RHS repeat-associated core domain-containing protein [Chryseobacterium sp. MEBOG06]